MAIVFDPVTHELLSEALSKYELQFFKIAAKRGIITNYDLKVLNETAKKIYYPQRNYMRVFSESGLEKEKSKNSKHIWTLRGIDIKAEDAKKVLKYIKNLVQ